MGNTLKISRNGNKGNTPLRIALWSKISSTVMKEAFFLESFNQKKFQDLTGSSFEAKQINFAKSQEGVLRGLHYQLNPHAQAKLVGVISGSVLDVVVDLRQSSPTFGRKFEILLNKVGRNLFVPRGFAHGYEVLEEDTIFYYAVDNFYAPDHERGLAYNDPKLNIEWQGQQPLISEKDKKNPHFINAEYNF